MARSNTIKVLRTTRAALDIAAAASGLLAGEPYLITDENRIAVGLTASTYSTCAETSTGTWTPSLKFGGNAVGMTYATRQGTYTKTGRRVLARLYIELSAKGSSTGTATIDGLPFVAAASPGFGAISVSFYSSLALTTLGLNGFVIGSGSSINLRTPTATSSPAANDTHFTNTSEMVINVDYET